MSFFRKSQSPPTPPQPTLPLHPYYPLGALIPSFAANDKDVVELLTLFAGMCGGLLAAVWFVVGKIAPDMRFWDKMIVLWFMLSTSDARMLRL